MDFLDREAEASDVSSSSDEIPMETEGTDFIDNSDINSLLPPPNPYLESSSSSCSSSSSSEDEKNRYKLFQLTMKFLKKRNRRKTPSKPKKKPRLQIIYSYSECDEDIPQPRTSTPIKKDNSDSVFPAVKKN